MNSKTLAVVLSAVSLAAGKLHAHEVLWWENPTGFTPNKEMSILYEPSFIPNLPDPDDEEYIDVLPTFFEPCTVEVNIDEPTSDLIDFEVIGPNPDIGVEIAVWAHRAPKGGLEKTTLSGEWHATGFPAGSDCTSVFPNRFTVPIRVELPIEYARWLWSFVGGTLVLDAGTRVGLQESGSLGGPWYNVGIGQKFMLDADDGERFYRATRWIGGPLTGQFMDNQGKPLKGLTIDLLHGGAGTTTDANGLYKLGGLPNGLNVLKVSYPVTLMDPGGAMRTEKLNLNLELPISRIPLNAMFQLDYQIGAGPSAGCGCTPWSAAGVGTLNGKRSPVFYGAGIFIPAGSPPQCGSTEYRLTDPMGSHTLQTGEYLHLNSGPNPTAGTWRVDSSVCGGMRTSSAWVKFP